MKTQFITSLKILAVMILLLGIVYPLLITGIAQTCFHNKANGSLIKKEGKIVGSELIGQQFNNLAYFTSRPSVNYYNTLPSAASNLSLTSKELWDVANKRKEKFIFENKLSANQKVPSEMIFASGSGLDPHISPDAAILQIDRIVHLRKFTDNQKQELLQLVRNYTEKPQWGFLGQPRVNVLLLNLQLDEIKQ